jgi:hypothetical protein
MQATHKGFFFIRVLGQMFTAFTRVYEKASHLK